MTRHRALLRLPLPPPEALDGLTVLELWVLALAAVMALASLYSLAVVLSLTFPAHLPPHPPAPVSALFCAKAPWQAGPSRAPCLDRDGSLIVRQ